MTELSKQADLACRGALHSGPQHDGHPRRWLILPVLLGGTFLLLVDFSVVNVALPLIRADLRADAGELQLIIAFYAVTYAVFLITGGRLGDLFGRKAMFMAGMAGFTAASAACGFAPSIHVLIAGRLLQGVAAAMLSPQVLATIRVIFPADERNRAIACYAATIGLGLVLGNVCGGLLIGLHPLGYTWRAVFLINLPVGAFDLAAAAWLLPPSPRSGNVRLDLTGVAMLSIGLLLLIDPLVAGREAGWPAWTLVCLALSVPAMALFIAFEQRVGRRGGDPLIDMRLFHDRGFSVGLALCLMVYASAGYFFCYAVYLQSGLGWSVVAAGLGMLPYAFGFLAGSLAVPSHHRPGSGGGVAAARRTTGRGDVRGPRHRRARARHRAARADPDRAAQHPVRACGHGVRRAQHRHPGRARYRRAGHWRRVLHGARQCIGPAGLYAGVRRRTGLRDRDTRGQPRLDGVAAAGAVRRGRAGSGRERMNFPSRPCVRSATGDPA
jgi:MFS family permease